MHANSAFRLLAMRTRDRAVFLTIERINPEEQWHKAQFHLLTRGFLVQNCLHGDYIRGFQSLRVYVTVGSNLHQNTHVLRI